MAKAKKRPVEASDKLLPKLTLGFFKRPILTGLLWLSLIVFGALSYTTLLKREGFPSINIPLVIVQGTYFVNDPALVDKNAAKPVADAALKQPGASTVQTQSSGNFFVVTAQFEEGIDAQTAADSFKQAVTDAGTLPKDANVQYTVPYFGATGGDSTQIDLAVSFFGKKEGQSSKDLAAKAEEAAKWLNDKNIADVKSVSVKSPFSQVINPATGQNVTVERNFDRFGSRKDGKVAFHDSLILAVAAEKGADVIKLDGHVRDALDELHKQTQFADYEAEISASFAPNIKDNLAELQKVLLEGLLAILVIGSIVITLRAAFITVLSMVTVLLMTLGLLYAIGYTLNVITLFALILGLALIVDDTIIMVEAIDAARHNHKDRRKIIGEATRKISRAMVAATVTAALSFAPLLFVGGILGSFIRAIPVTLISALVISLLVALVVIPFFSRFILLGSKHLGRKAAVERSAGYEAKLAHFITRPMRWARASRKRLITVIAVAVLIGFGFIGTGLGIARYVVFNIFPPTKDTNGLIVNFQYPQGTTIDQAKQFAAQADTLVADTLKDNFEYSSYFATGSAENATLQIELKPYSKRDVKSPELVGQLQEVFDSKYSQAQATVGQVDVGPPSAAFTVQIEAEDRDAAFRLANDLAKYLGSTELKRPDGSTARLTNARASNPGQYARANGKPVVTVVAGFEDTDTSTLVNLAQEAVKKEFPESRVTGYGLSPSALSFDIGQEAENQESFKTLALAFPVLLMVMYVLLAIEFRSLVQPLLIFMAIPFSIFGVMLGLKLTDNAISFFAMLGFFALVGLSIKNTILLTDYANQARRDGHAPIDAAVAALEERFRPLFATSLTAVVSLIPLALISPFWEGLAVVLIFGLISSTFLVITVFPYYYLGAEYLRRKVTAKMFFMWLIPTLIVAVLVGMITTPTAGLIVPILSLYFLFLQSYFRRRLSRQ